MLIINELILILRRQVQVRSEIEGGSEEQRLWLADPQTSGGLLIAVDESEKEAFEKYARSYGHDMRPIGRLVARMEKRIRIS